MGDEEDYHEQLSVNSRWAVSACYDPVMQSFVYLAVSLSRTLKSKIL